MGTSKGKKREKKISPHTITSYILHELWDVKGSSTWKGGKNYFDGIKNDIS